MKRTAKYVGLDVHPATVVSTVRLASRRVLARDVLPLEASALLEYVGRMGGPVQVVFEEGPQAQWLYDLLVPVVDRVVVCDRRGTGRRRGNKGDQPDADRLSADLVAGDLRAVYHGGPGRETLRELTRAYRNVVEDSTRVMLRLKSLFRARAIMAKGTRIYAPAHTEEWLGKLANPGARCRAAALYTELQVLRAVRPKVKAAMIAEARRDPAWPVLRTIPFLGPVRISYLLAVMRTPWRFRNKRNLWGYAGLAVVTETSSEYEFIRGRPVRRQRKPLTRGLNQNHNRVLKEVFKGAATAAIGRRGALQDLYRDMVGRGMREEMARVTLARKLAALTLRLWKTGERYDPTKLTLPAT